MTGHLQCIQGILGVGESLSICARHKPLNFEKWAEPDPKGPCMYNDWNVWTFLWDAEHGRIRSGALEAFMILSLLLFFSLFSLTDSLCSRNTKMFVHHPFPTPRTSQCFCFLLCCLAYVVLTSPCSPATTQGPQGPLSAGYYSSCSPEVTLSRKSSRVLSPLTLRQSSEFTFNECPLCVKHPGVYFMSIIWCNPQNSIK